MQPDRDDDRPWLFLGLGWHWNDAGVWAVTARARSNVRFMAQHRGDAERRPVREWDPVPAIEGAEGYQAHNLPIVVVCPNCGTPQRLEPAKLGIGDGRHEHRMISRVGINGAPERVLCCNEGRDRGYITAALSSRRLTN